MKGVLAYGFIAAGRCESPRKPHLLGCQGWSAGKINHVSSSACHLSRSSNKTCPFMRRFLSKVGAYFRRRSVKTQSGANTYVGSSRNWYREADAGAEVQSIPSGLGGCHLHLPWNYHADIITCLIWPYVGPPATFRRWWYLIMNKI